MAAAGQSHSPVVHVTEAAAPDNDAPAVDAKCGEEVANKAFVEGCDLCWRCDLELWCSALHFGILVRLKDCGRGQALRSANKQENHVPVLRCPYDCSPRRLALRRGHFFIACLVIAGSTKQRGGACNTCRAIKILVDSLFIESSCVQLDQ